MAINWIEKIKKAEEEEEKRKEKALKQLKTVSLPTASKSKSVVEKVSNKTEKIETKKEKPKFDYTNLQAGIKRLSESTSKKEDENISNQKENILRNRSVLQGKPNSTELYRYISDEQKRKKEEYLNSDEYNAYITSDEYVKKVKDEVADKLRIELSGMMRERNEAKQYLDNIGGQGRFLYPEKVAEKEERIKYLDNKIALVNKEIDEYSSIKIDNYIKYWANKVAKGFVSGGESLADFLIANTGTAVTTGQKLFGVDEDTINNTEKAFADMAKVDVAGAGFDKVLEEEASKIGIENNGRMPQIVEGVARNAFDAMTSWATGGISTGASVGGSYIGESLDDGANLTQATVKADTIGLIVGKMETWLNKGFGLTGESALSKLTGKSKLVADFVEDLSRTKTGRIGLKAISEILEGTAEVGEEFAEEIIDDVTTKAIYDRSREVGITGEEAKEIALMTYIQTALLRTATGQNISNVEINEAIKIAQEYKNIHQNNSETNNVVQQKPIEIEVLPTAKTEVKQEEKTELPTANSQPILRQSQVAEYVNEKNVASEVKNRMQSVVNKTNKIANSDVQLQFASLDGDKKAQTDGNTITVDISKASLEDVIHEITHNTETSKGYMAVSDYILTELDKRGELQGIKDEIASIYSPVYKQEGRTFTEQDLESEIVAKYTEQFANDENFVNKITQEDRNFAQKIYDWIKEKVNYYRTVKNMTDEQRTQYDELRRAEKLWLKALQSDNIASKNDTRYSFIGQKGMRNYSQNRYGDNGIQSLFNTAREMKALGVDNGRIRQSTNWFQDKNGDWKFEFSDKDMSLKKVRLEENKSYKLGEILEHNTLFMAYPELANLNVKFTDLGNANGGFYRNKNMIAINNHKVKTKQSIEATLTHEIQHAIQKIEGFERGSNTRLSKERYYKSLGEIEASDVKDRFLKERKEINVSAIAPRASKANPEHKDLKKYLKNRGIVDKVKDSVYNYFEKRVKNNEENIKEIRRNNYDTDSEIILQNRRETNGQIWNRLGNQGRRLVDVDLERGIRNEIHQEDVEQDSRKNNRLVDGGKRLNENIENDIIVKEVYVDGENEKIVSYTRRSDNNRGQSFGREQGNDTKTIYRKFRKDFEQKGYTNLSGTKIETSADLADVAQVFRDPRYETLRIVYVKDNVIVGHEAKTTRNPMSVKMFRDQTREIYQIKDRKRRLEADGYYLIHNHPSGKAIASDADKNLTAIINQRISGFKGHLIINSGTYDWIDVYNGKAKNTGTRKIENYVKSDIDNMMDENPMLNIKIDRPEVMIELMNNVKNSDNYSMLILADNQLKVNLLQDINKSIINMKNNDIKRYLENQARKNGCSYAFFVTSNRDIFEKAKTLVKDGILMDSIFYKNNGDGTSLESDSARTLLQEDIPNRLFDISKDRIIRVNEETEKYSSKTNEGKERKHYKSIATSGMVGEQGRKVARNLLEKDRYIPTSNAKQMEHADNVVKNAGIESGLESFRNKIKTEQRLTPNDLALGERLIQEYSRSGDIETLNNLIQDVAIIGTELGQTVQALSLIHKMSPEGQLMTLQKSINRLNMNEQTNIKLTNEQTQKIIKAKGEQELQEAMAEVSKEIAEQIPLKATDKLRSWRYLSMLGNPRTHIRNILSNVAMKGTKAIKDAVAGTIEDVIKPTERTRTLKRASKETKAFAKQDANERIEMIANGGKYDVNTAIKQSKRQFNNKVLNALAEFNSNALETEDKIFLKSAYTQALSKYMTANNLTAKYLQSGTKEANIALTKARDFATLEAQVATFRQFSWLASKISQIENKNNFNKVVVGGLLPFKKTPINIAKTGIDYSPIGLIKGMTYDMVKLKKGDISSNKFIDNISKGLTGTSISLLGYFLAQAGILKASGDDDDRAEDYDTSIGNQQYAIKLGNKTFTIDWLSPTAMPLFVGAEFFNATNDKNEINLNALATATTKTLNPLTEMSMLQSFASTLSSFNTEGSAGKLGDMGANMIESYIGQYFPTIVGQLARIVDDTERDTYYTDKSGAEARVQRFINKQVAKTPFLSQTLEPKVDVWGEEVKKDENIALRTFNQLLNPSYVKTVQNSTADKEVQRLYKASEDSNVLPKAPNSKFSIDAVEYKLTPQEYTTFKKSVGKYNKNVLNNITTQKEYTSLTDAEKVKTIDALYDDSRNKAIQSYANNNKIKYDGTDDVDTLINKKDLSLANAYIYRGNVKGIKSEKDNNGETIDGSMAGNKAKYIMALNTSKEQKNLLLTLTTSSKVKPTVEDLNTIGEKNYSTYYSISNAQSREKYVNLASTGMNASALNKYIENIGSIEGKKDSNGKTINGTLKTAKANYINSLSISRNEKLLLFGKDYKLSASERQQVLKYVNSLDVSSKQKLEILSQLKGVTIKNNKLYWD